ncbi:MAG: 3-phosphoserine/phosphohydroxythreonine transaminase [Phycisphaerales bacterium]|nr:3-phosphoserine/phosphohydroxythreonine transaminase [Phycisphaerales bacterium]
MSERAYNFSAGPAILPEPVLKQAQKDIWNIFDSGMGVLELSHRGPQFDRILAEAEADCREVGNIPDNYRVLFLQGGATLQTAMIPMSFLPAGETADYFDTGKWASDAIKEAKKFGTVHVAGTTKELKYKRLPTEAETRFSPDAAYCFFVSNNTIYGTQWHNLPKSRAPIVCDMSSDFFCRPHDFTKYAMVYASAQKNIGPSGQAIAVISDEFLANAPEGKLATMLDYKVMAAQESRPNTPNTFAIYLMGQCFKWIKNFGGLRAIEEYNKEKAKIVYDYLDNSKFFIPHAEKQDRSLMNITFKCAKPELDEVFIDQAENAGLKTIAGHRSIGGMRASIYNAFPIEGCRALVKFMKDFESKHG